MCIFDELFETGVFFREEALEDGAEAVAVVLALRLPAFGGGVGDGVLEAALEEVGVDKRERDELGVSDLGSAPVEFPREFCTGLFPLEFAEVTDIGVSSSKSMRRCVFERRLELARPVMISFDEFFCVS